MYYISLLVIAAGVFAADPQLPENVKMAVETYEKAVDEARKIFDIEEDKARTIVIPILKVAYDEATKKGDYEMSVRINSTMDYIKLGKSTVDPIGEVKMNMKVIVMNCYTYLNENDQVWPKGIKEIMGVSKGQLNAKYFRFPGFENVQDAIVYVRPDPTVRSSSPVLITNPVCLGGRGSIVCYADNHLGIVNGTALWEEGLKFVKSPKLLQQGITTNDWIAIINTETGIRK